MFGTAPAKRAVLEILPGAPGMAGVLVRRGLPTASVPGTTPERVYIVGSRGMDREPPPGPRGEEFRINLLVEVLGDLNGEALDAEDRMWEIADAIDAQVTTDPEWGVAVWGSGLELVEEHVAPNTSADRYIARGHFSLVCHTRQ